LDSVVPARELPCWEEQPSWPGRKAVGGQGRLFASRLELEITWLLLSQ